MRVLFCGVSAAALLSAAQVALAQDAPASSAPDAQVSEVIVTGTRQTGVRAADSAQPIQVVGAQAFQHVGQPDLQQVLQQTVPSFNAQQYGADSAALTVQAALRGLNPNDTLVLVNGKRRHATANLSVDPGSPYSGSASVDLGLIPTGEIDHIEVLPDGAAAQYGSDAIAGVVNIILKNSDHGGEMSATGGEYYEGDGETGAGYINKGFSLGDKGFVDLTLETRYHGFSQQGGADRRVYNPDGSFLPSVVGTIDTNTSNVSGAPNVNHINGDTQFRLYDGFYNAGYKINDEIEIYSFGSYAKRLAAAYENYRVPSKSAANECIEVAACVYPQTTLGPLVYALPDGFSPREHFDEYDYSFTGGIKGGYADWAYDLSASYGEDKDSVYTQNSANFSEIQQQQALSTTPISYPVQTFYDGSFHFTELTTNLDITRQVDLGIFAKPLSVAFGGEFRRNTFGISAGSPSSYFGDGAASFIGYTPTDAGLQSRTNEAVYIDLATDPVANLHVDAAGRYEHYSDFGSALIGKLTARYDFAPQFAIRGTVSDGFRAPTLQEEFYSGTNVGPSSAYVQLPANSAAAAVAGFKPLQPEKSTNFSAGFVAHPIPRLQVTVDYYHIDLQGRILNSGSVVGLTGNFPNQTIVSRGVLKAIQARGISLDTTSLTYAGINIFGNAADTTTEGVEATASYASDFGGFGHVDWTVGFNYNDTTIDTIAALPASVQNAAAQQTSFLTAQALSASIDGVPKEKAVLNALWGLGKFSVNLRETIYGQTSEALSISGTGTGNGATNLVVGTTGITDLDISYKVTPQLRLNIGANNLFNQYPEKVPNASNGAGGVRPADGGNVYGVPATFSPYGFNGGYYYGRVTYSF